MFFTFPISGLFTLGVSFVVITTVIVFKFVRSFKKTKTTTLAGATGRPIKAPSLSLQANTLGELFQLRANETPDCPAFYEKKNGEWVSVDWKTTYDHCLSYANHCIEKHHLEIGDRVCILGPTSPRWAELDLGSYLAGLVPVGIYTHQAVNQYEYIINHCDGKLVFVSGEDDLLKIIEAVKGNDKIKAIVPWEDDLFLKYCNVCQQLESISAFFSNSIKEEKKRMINDRFHTVQRTDMATIIYTSGTTGHPKGCVLTHHSILSLLNMFTTFAENIGIEIRQDDTVMSFLPMAHVAERDISFYFRVSTGMPGIYASSIASVIDEMAETNPTFFGLVPRVLEKAYFLIMRNCNEFGVFGRLLFKWSETISGKVVDCFQNDRIMPLSLQIQYFIIDFLLFRQIRKRFGNRVRAIFVGAAATPLHIIKFFLAARVPLFEMYGASEVSGATHANYGFTRKFNHLGTQGMTGPGVLQKIDETTGELLLKGEMLFKEYFKDEQTTKEAFTSDGYFKTGDVATIDEEGFMKISDRLKNIIITSGGKNIAPLRIEETLMKQSPLIAHAYCHGERRKYITAIISVDSSEVIKLGMKLKVIKAERGKKLQFELMKNPYSRSEEINNNVKVVCAHKKLREMIIEAIRKGNRELSQVEQIKRIVLLYRELSQNYGEVTPTLKTKRSALETNYKDALDALYDDDFFVNGVGTKDICGLQKDQFLVIQDYR